MAQSIGTGAATVINTVDVDLSASGNIPVITGYNNVNILKATAASTLFSYTVEEGKIAVILEATTSCKSNGENAQVQVTNGSDTLQYYASFSESDTDMSGTSHKSNIPYQVEAGYKIKVYKSNTSGLAAVSYILIDA